MVASQVFATVIAIEVLHAEVHNAIVEVSPQRCVPGSGLHFRYTILLGQKGNIEGSSVQVVDHEVTLSAAVLVETSCDSRCGGFADDAHHLEA